LNQATTIANAFGTYDWDAQVYEALSVASRVAASVKNRANVLRLAYRLYVLSNSLNVFLDTVHATMEGRKPVDPNAEPLTPERLKSTADNLIHLHRTIEYIYEGLRRVGLTNNSLTAGSLRSINKNGPELLDLADWLELLASPKEFEAIFERAEHERESGELYDIDQVN